jgi:hypothetical protein
MTPEQIATATFYVQIALLIIQIPTLVALIIYVIKTGEMASASRKSTEIAEKSLLEMREQRDAEIAPYVVAYLDGQGAINGILYLVIKNTGKTVAKDVKVVFDPPLQPQFPDLLAKVLPPDGIPSIPPGYEIKTTLDSFVTYKHSKPMAFTVKVTYFGGITNKPREDKYHLDLELFRGIVYTVESKEPNETAKAIQKTTESVVRELQNISDTISKSSKGNKIRKRNFVTKKRIQHGGH